ncbi:hypothetical protein [Bailinhaonella thermotolerans]|nr:hypothetical protein [Bailinhaonella thermotolerans]
MTYFKRRAGRAVLGAVLALGAVGGLAPGAQANDFGYPSGCCSFADNGQHWYNDDSLESRTKSAFRYAMGNLDAQSVMSDAYDASPNASTDVEAYDAYYVDTWDLDWDGSTTGYNLYGYAKCVKAIAPTPSEDDWRCDQYEVRFDLRDVDGFSTDQRRALACHEVGHTVGLSHSTESSSCLRTGAHTTVKYSAHDVSHLYTRYGPRLSKPMSGGGAK